MVQRKLSELQKKNPINSKILVEVLYNFNECFYKYKSQCIDTEKNRHQQKNKKRMGTLKFSS